MSDTKETKKGQQGRKKATEKQTKILGNRERDGVTKNLLRKMKSVFFISVVHIALSVSKFKVKVPKLCQENVLLPIGIPRLDERRKLVLGA